MAATSSTAAWKMSSLAREGWLKPEILRTNWSEAAWISASVTGGSKLKRVLMFRHMGLGFCDAVDDNIWEQPRR